MKKNHEVVGVVIDAIQQNDTLKFLSAILECTIKDFDKITYNENSTVEDYLSTFPIFQNDVFSMQAMLELAGLKGTENHSIKELTIGEKKLLLLITLIVDTSKQYLLQNLFQNMQEPEVKCATELLKEMSTYTDIILVSSSTYGYEICDRMIYWPDDHRIDDGEYHISRNKIKEMCIMPTFIMKEIIKVIKENQTTDIAIPLWRVVPGEYEEYAYQVLNSNADKERFDYPYISHRPFRYGDVYWIMEHHLQFVDITKEEQESASKQIDQTEQLTLFLERPYFKGISEEKEREIVQFVLRMLKQKAKKMSAQLILSNDYKALVPETSGLVRAQYHMYISASKNGKQYLDSLGGMATINNEGSYEKGMFLLPVEFLRQNTL